MDRELRTRALTSGAIGLVVIISAISGTSAMVLLLVVITSAVCFELFTLSAPFAHRGYRLLKVVIMILPIVAYGWNLLVPGTLGLASGAMIPLAAGSFFVASLLIFISPVVDKGKEIALFTFGLVAIFLPGVYAVDLAAKSPYLLLGIFILLWANDVFAYLLGRRFGRRKLAPVVSPGKTWEGFIAGGVTTAVVSALLGRFLPVVSVGDWVFIAILVIVFGTLGDLIESAVKRNCKAKDSGKLLPGHGGFWDRFDSFYGCVAPVAIYVLYFSSFE